MDATTLGRRIAEGRVAAGMSQSQLAAALDLVDHTTVSKMESGTRRVSATEMFSIAETLGKPLQWFVMDELPAAVSRRTDSGFDPEAVTLIDDAIELFADDLRSLLRKDLIVPVQRPEPLVPRSHEDAERVAADIRSRLGLNDDPVIDILDVCERLGMYTFVGEFGEVADGACVVVDGVGETGVAAAVVNGARPSGRKRVTVAHELAHWLVGDAYDAHDSDSETMVKSVAIHFLIPRGGATKLWNAHLNDPLRRRVIRVAGSYRVSWTAAVNQLKNIGLIDERERSRLAQDVPVASEFVATGVSFQDDQLLSPRLSPRLAAAVVNGYEVAVLTRKRALQMLRGSVGEVELRTRDAVRFGMTEADV